MLGQGKVFANHVDVRLQAMHEDLAGAVESVSNEIDAEKAMRLIDGEMHRLFTLQGRILERFPGTRRPVLYRILDRKHC